jgi:peptidyl-prolyl cis-trans isomerase B (cyclophilin B)
MRPAIAIFFLIVAGVMMAALVSLHTTHPDPLQTETEAAKPTEQAKPATVAKPADGKLDVESKFDKVKAGAIRASMDIAGRGTIEMELYPQAAPKTVAHLVELANKNFWDGVKIHRVEPSVVQMGDPASKDVRPEDFELKGIGTHGSGTTVPLEVSAQLPNIQYTLGLARTSERNSGDSQFFINMTDNPDFDYDYCVFGRVVKNTTLLSQLKKGDVIKHFQVYPAGPK